VQYVRQLGRECFFLTQKRKTSDSKEGWIPSSLYNQMAKSMPIPAVEAIIVRNGSLLFLKRNNIPVKGQWWFPGGRIRKGESLEEALFREVKEETGLNVIAYELVNVYSRVFPDRHDITIVYSCKCDGDTITLNGEHSEYKFFKDVPKDLHPCLLQAIHDSNWKRMRGSREN